MLASLLLANSLWESFPQILESQEGARRYINAFRAPFQELPSLSLQQTNTLWVCSLLVKPPPIGRMVPQGGFPSDLTELNLSGWADLVQDVAAGLQVLPPRLCLNLGTPDIALLQLLETATGVGFCHHCCHPRSCCMCTGASQSAPSMSWSQIVQQTQGYGVTSTSGVVTHLSTPMGGMPGYMVLPPGLTPPDFSSWSIPPPEVPPPLGIPASPLHWPPMGRASLLTLHQRAPVLRSWCHRLLCHRLQSHKPYHHRLPRQHHPCTSHSHPPGVSWQPLISRWCSCQSSPRGGESPSTPPLIKLQQ